MSYDSYSALIDEVVDETARNDLAGKVLSWLDLVEKRLVRECKYFRGSVFETTGTFDAGVDRITLPTGLRELLLLRIDASDALRVNLVGWDKYVDVQANATRSGVASVMVIHHFDQYTLLCQPPPAAADPYTLYWRGKLSVIDETKMTSQVLEEAPDLLLHGALFHAWGYTRNSKEEAKNKQLYDVDVREYHKFLWNAHFGGGTSRVRPDTYPQDSHTREFSSP